MYLGFIWMAQQSKKCPISNWSAWGLARAKPITKIGLHTHHPPTRNSSSWNGRLVVILIYCTDCTVQWQSVYSTCVHTAAPPRKLLDMFLIRYLRLPSRSLSTLVLLAISKSIEFKFNIQIFFCWVGQSGNVLRFGPGQVSPSWI